MKEFEKLINDTISRIILKIISQSRTKSIGISIKGEHSGEQTIVIPYGGSLNKVLHQIN